jgi:DNA invertase Pin-like site-specific DNA recombinase
MARNLAFIATLMDSGVEFVAVDNPHANKLTVHILAAVAQHEREMIAQRTRDVLKAAKARGKRLGSPKLEKARQQAFKANRGRPSGLRTMCCRSSNKSKRAAFNPFVEWLGRSQLGGLRLDLTEGDWESRLNGAIFDAMPRHMH